jgi:hypothetical protein
MKNSTLRQNGSRSLFAAWGVLRIATGRPSVEHANAGRQETGAALKAIHNARPAPSSSPYGGVILSEAKDLRLSLARQEKCYLRIGHDTIGTE